MSEENLSDLLERAADHHAVGAPPLDQMLSRGQRARKRRAGFMALAASVVVGSVIVGTSLLVGGNASPEPSPIDNPATPAIKPIALDGEWRVVGLVDDEGESLLRSVDKVRVRFHAGKVGGSTECNSFSFSGRYKQSGPGGRDLFVPRRFGTTLVGCGETPIATRLLAVRHVSEANGVLYLRAENGAIIAELEPPVLDPLTYKLLLGTRDGNRLPSRIRVENTTGRTVTDPGCLMDSNYSWGVVPVSTPDKPHFSQVITRCLGPQDLPDGFVGTFEGPTFSLRDLRPGDYLATIDFGDARSERLTERLTIDGP